MVVSMKKVLLKCFCKRFLQYFAVLVLTLLFATPAYSKMIQTANKTIVTDAEKNAKYLLNNFLSQILYAEDIANSIIQNNHFNVLSLLQGEPTPSYYFNIQQLDSDVNMWCIGNNALQNIYILFQHNDIFISSDVSSDNYKKVYESRFSYEGMSVDEWRSKIFSLVDQNIRILPTQSIYMYKNIKENFQGFTYFVSSTSYAEKSSDYVISFIYDVEEMMSLFLTDETIENAYICIVDIQGTVLFSYNYDYPTYVIEDNAAITTIDNVKYRQINVLDSEFGLQIITGINLDDFNVARNFLIQQTLTTLAVGIILILILISLISYGEYLNLKKLLMLSYECDEERSEGLKIINEYDYIQKSMNFALSENQQYIIRAHTLNVSAKTYILQNIIAIGAYTEQEQQAALSIWGDSFNRYLIIKVKHDSNSLTTTLEVETQLQKQFEQNIFIMSNYQELTGILFLEQDSNDNIHLIQEKVTKCIDVEDDKKIGIGVGISTFLSGIELVKQGYSQANIACTMALEDFANNCQIYDDSKITDNINPIFDISLLTKLYTLCMESDQESAINLFDTIANYINEQNLDHTHSLQIYFALRHTIDNVINTLARKISPQIISISMPKFSPTIPIKEAIQKLRELLPEIFEFSSQLYIESSTKENHKIITYINEHFTECTLNANVIAEEFNLSEKYIFSIVKNISGQTLHQFIRELRLFKAEEYLLQGIYTNKEIIELVGFGSEKSFYRAFEQKHGISPQKWKYND